MLPKPDAPRPARSTVQQSQASLGTLPNDDSVANSATARPSERLPPSASLNVMHLHPFGSCRGRLTISNEGLKYAPDKHAKDAFAAPSVEFVHSTADDILTVKTAAKTYRFKAAASGGNGGAQLRNSAAAIALFRQPAAPL